MGLFELNVRPVSYVTPPHSHTLTEEEAELAAAPLPWWMMHDRYTLMSF